MALRVCLVLLTTLQGASLLADEHPLTPARRAELVRSLQVTIEQMSRRLDVDAMDVEALSRRGDAYFFQGEFRNAVADYEQMIVVDPNLQASHWRLGIAAFYAGDYQRAVRQFERYHTIDRVDRENGIWRYFSQLKADGREKARANLLKYDRDDREPFPAVYRLFAGTETPEQILQQIDQADLPADERQKRLFYAHLYIGLNAAVEGERESAREHLHKAVANPWPQKAGYGPSWMWHVGRVQYDRLEVPQKQQPQPR